MCSRELALYILKEIMMKNSLKTLRIALASTALISVFAPNAQAQTDLKFQTNVTGTLCTPGMYTATSGGTANNTLVVTDVTLADINGDQGKTAGQTAFYVGVPSSCYGGGTTNTSFNIGFHATAVSGGRALNSGNATGVTFDLISTGTTGKAIVLTTTAPASSTAATQQTGLQPALFANRQTYAIRLIKTAATGTFVQPGTVISNILATGYYP